MKNFIESYKDYVNINRGKSNNNGGKIILLYLLILFIGGLAESVFVSAYTMIKYPQLMTLSQNYVLGKITYESLVVEMAIIADKIPFFITLLCGVFYIAIIAITIKKSEKRRFVTLGLIDKKGFNKYLLGIGIGLLVLLISVGIMYVTKNVNFKGNENGLSYIFVIYLIAWIVQSLFEEVLYRGYLLQSFSSVTNVKYGIIVSSLFFALSHFGNAGFSLIAIINIFAAGLFFTLLTLYTKSIYASWGFHFIWNCFQGNVLGINVSGYMIKDTLLVPSYSNKVSFTGGSFGIEGSIFTTLAFAILIGVLVFIMLKKHLYNQQIREDEKSE